MKIALLSNLFEIKYGNSFDLTNLVQCSENDKNGINYISRTRENNGISAKVFILDGIKPFPPGLITVAGSGNSVLEASLQFSPFYTGFHVFVLYPKTKMSDLEKLFYCHCIKKNRYRYNFGRQANRTLGQISVPSSIPSDFNNIVIEKLSNISNKPVINQSIDLNTSIWKYFKTKDIFESIAIAKSTDLNKLEIDPNGINYIGRTRGNNGITEKVKITDEYVKHKIKGKCITVAMVGDSTCSAFYQNDDFFASQNILVLRNNKLNLYNSIFINVLIGLEKYRFSYGRTLTKTFFENMALKLPVNKKGKPDFAYMELFIKSLPFSISI